MKNIKKLLSIVMMLALVLSLGASAFAATVTLPADAEDHDMVAYQIFTGEQLEAGENNAQLGVTGWGVNVQNPTKFLEAMATAYPNAGFKTDMTAVQAAKVISDMSKTNSDAANVALANAIATAVKAQDVDGVHFAGDEEKTATLNEGYWVIVDETVTLPGDEENGFESRSTTLLEVVGTSLTLQDKIDQPTLKKEADGAAAEVKGLGETVTFTLTVTLPDNYADFATYYLKFVDTMTKGLELDMSSFKISYNGADAVSVPAESVRVSGNSTEGTSFEYEITNLKDVAPGLQKDNTVVLTYEAKVTVDAVVRNENKAHIEYSRTPSPQGSGEHETIPGPDETVVVFTFTIDGSKVKPTGEVDEEGNEMFEPLAGAAFTLYKKDASGEYVEYRAEVEAKGDAENGYKFDFDQLGVGEYKLVETKVPAGYNKADDIYFSVEERHDDSSDLSKVTGAVAKDADGEVLGEVKFEMAKQVNEGVIPQQVINREGMQLPETGGMGTTIFYVVGAILVVGAVILLVTRKRMSGAAK